jgi:cellulose synthase/poly-beta-1,6-N-acetylglucosamine synthase-like glycosyltransferase
VVVPSFNNNQLFRVELNLNSIFAQNYSNYKVLIIDDASIDGTQDLIERYLNYYAIPESKAQLIKNTVSQKALQNIYEGILSSCTDQEIVVIVDGDD